MIKQSLNFVEISSKPSYVLANKLENSVKYIELISNGMSSLIGVGLPPKHYHGKVFNYKRLIQNMTFLPFAKDKWVSLLRMDLLTSYTC